MLELEEQIYIKQLLEEGCSVPEIAQRIRRSTTTIYRYRSSNSISTSVTPSTLHSLMQKQSDDVGSSKLAPFIDYLLGRMRHGMRNSSKLYKELLLKGYIGTYAEVNTFVKNNRIRLLDSYTPATQHITGPGEEAQVDWGSFGRVVINGKEEKLYVFVYVLSYSRTLYIEFVVRQNQKTLQECHIHAFHTLGIPKKIVYDNMKTVVISHPKKGKGDVRFNQAFMDFARHYDFEPYACHPYWPRAKGKVESGVKYVRNNFMHGMLPKKEFISLEHLNQKAREWVKIVANERIHGTTKEKPYDLWVLEKETLHFPDNERSFNTSMLNMRHSTKDGLVQYKSCFYSVPRDFALKKLYIRDIALHGLPMVEIYYLDNLVATHHMSFERGRWVTNDEHLLKVHKPQSFRKLKKTKRVFSYKRPRTNVAVRDLNFYNLLLTKKKHGKKKS